MYINSLNNNYSSLCLCCIHRNSNNKSDDKTIIFTVSFKDNLLHVDVKKC